MNKFVKAYEIYTVLFYVLRFLMITGFLSFAGLQKISILKYNIFSAYGR